MARRLKVQGLDKLRRNCRRMANVVRAAAFVAVGDGAEAIADAARDRAPVRTGTMRDAIKVRRSIPRPGVARAEVYIDADDFEGDFYPPMVEFGTEDTPAQPFMRPAADEKGAAAVRRTRRGIAIAIEAAGEKGRG